MQIEPESGTLNIEREEALFKAKKVEDPKRELYSIGNVCKVTLQSLQNPTTGKTEAFMVLKALARACLNQKILSDDEISDAIRAEFTLSKSGARPYTPRKPALVHEEFSTSKKGKPLLSSEDLAAAKQNFEFAQVEVLPQENTLTNKENIQELMRMLIYYYSKLRSIVQVNVPELRLIPEDPQTLELISGFLSSTNLFNKKDLQALLEALNIKNRLELCLRYLALYEREVANQWDQLEKNRNLPVDSKSEKKHYLDLYNFLKKSFENPNKKPIIEQIRNNMEGKTFPQEVKNLIEEDIAQLSELNESHPEYNIHRSFLELITSLPFGIHSKDNLDIAHARRILDEDHYGLEDVKNRVLEFIAVSKLKGGVKGKSICLVGPPGVGKTSIGESIAKCLNRKFVRISVGGEYDISILKGHRQTYIGAYPGKLVEALKNCGTDNPVILIDEIDKIATGYSGNLQDVLLEVLDPVQNVKFTDHYLDVPIDLSNVLFLCTANLLETIHPAVLDRMEVIQLSGYTKQEKKEIFKRYLLPKALEAAGLKGNYESRITIHEDAIEKLVNNYAREAGVRNLERLVKRICEKLAFKFLSNQHQQIEIGAADLKEYVGLPKFSDQKVYEGIPPPGVIIGLAYNSYGGSVIYIETIKRNFEQIQPSTEQKNKTTEENVDVVKKDNGIRRGALKVTGSLGEVMQESIQIAYTHAKHILSMHLNSDYLEKNDVHIHFPDGASKKDGPSAGIAITSSLISLATNVPIADLVAMTGEISLTGKVLKIGGVREKVLAAKREGISKVILPLANKQDVEDLKDYIKERVEFYYAETYSDVMKILFPSLVQSSQSFRAQESSQE